MPSSAAMSSPTTTMPSACLPRMPLSRVITSPITSPETSTPMPLPPSAATHSPSTQAREYWQRISPQGSLSKTITSMSSPPLLHNMALTSSMSTPAPLSLRILLMAPAASTSRKAPSITSASTSSPALRRQMSTWTNSKRARSSSAPATTPSMLASLPIATGESTSATHCTTPSPIPSSITTPMASTSRTAPRTSPDQIITSSRTAPSPVPEVMISSTNRTAAITGSSTATSTSPPSALTAQAATSRSPGIWTSWQATAQTTRCPLQPFPSTTRTANLHSPAQRTLLAGSPARHWRNSPGTG